MTGKNYNTEVIDIKVKMPDDEWNNSTLTEAKIMFMQGEYYKALKNPDILVINAQKRTDPEIAEQSRRVREKSFTAALNEKDRAAMKEGYKRTVFRMMRIMQDYVLDGRYGNGTATGRTVGKSVDELISDKINGTATGGKAK